MRSFSPFSLTVFHIIFFLAPAGGPRHLLGGLGAPLRGLRPPVGEGPRPGAGGDRPQDVQRGQQQVHQGAMPVDTGAILREEGPVQEVQLIFLFYKRVNVISRIFLK